MAYLFPDFVSPATLLRDLLDVSLTGVNLLRPLYGPGGELKDFALEYLNPAAQHMTGLSEQPGGTTRAHFPDIFANGVFDFYRRVFETGEAGRYSFNCQADSFDNYFHVAARRSGELLVVSFTDTADQDRSPVEVALRESQARERAARADAEAQHQRFYEVLQQLPALIATYHGPEHVYNFVNPAYRRYFDHDALLGRPVREVLPEAEEQGMFALMDRVYQTGEPYYGSELEVWLDFTGGAAPRQQVFLNLLFHPLRDAQGQVTGLLDFSYDVTEQVQARRQVQHLNQELEARVIERTSELEVVRAATERQRRQWEALFWRAPASICILDGPEWVYQFVNPGYQAMFPGQELLGKRLLDVFPEVVNQPLLRILRQVYDTGESFEGTEVLVPLARTEGGPIEDIYFDLTYQARYNETGQIDGFITYAYDVTQRVRARQRQEAYAAELQESEARFRTLADAAPNMVWDLNPDGSVRYVNKYCLEFLGITLAEFVARNWTPYLLPEDVAPTEQLLGQAIAGRTLFSMEHRMLRHDGQYRWLLTQGGPSYYASGELYGYVGAAFDINDLKQANEQLRRTNTDLDNFIYTASHDLKAPISNIEGLLYLLREELPAEVTAQGNVAPSMQLMLDAVERFKRTIEHLTEVSKLQKENAPVTTPVDLAAVVEDVRQDLRPLLEQTHARLLVSIPPLPPVQFSEKNLRSVVYNLLSNALKYHHPDRSLHVDLRAHAQKNFIVLEVHDNGLGIDPVHLPKLFGMFQRFYTHVEGTGIGLYMVKRMVENAGGRLEVHSQLDAGTTIFVHLPHTPRP